MKMDQVAGSQYDEYYTPQYAVYPIIKYLKPHSHIWCPFDTHQSNFVKLLEKEGHMVTYTHKDNRGEDFFQENRMCDYIVSNPPYSLKNEIFDRLFKLGKPFAMLVGVVGIFESQKRFNMFKDNQFEILYMNKRISYFKDFNTEVPDVNPPFSSVYICSDILPKQIVFEEVNK